MRNHSVIFIDWDKTLSDSLFWHGLNKNDPVASESVNTWLFRDNLPLVMDWMRGKIETSYVIEQVSQSTGLCSVLLQEELERSCREMTYISDDSLLLISELRQKGFRIVLATDSMDVFSDYTAPYRAYWGL